MALALTRHQRPFSNETVFANTSLAAMGLSSPLEIGEPKRRWQGLDAMDGGQRRVEQDKIAGSNFEQRLRWPRRGESHGWDE